MLLFLSSLAFILFDMSIRMRAGQGVKTKGSKDKAQFRDNSGLKSVCRKRTKPNTQVDSNPYEKIPEIPNIKLTVSDMNSDPIALLAKLEEQYKEYGAVRLTASEEWNCPFTFRYVDKGITTRVQKLQSLKAGKAFEQNVESYNIKSFETFASNFQHTYRYKTSPTGNSNEAKKQAEYWNLVTKPQYEKKQVKVEYAADLPSIKYGSGFPTSPISYWKDTDFAYEKNLFNLNNIMKSGSSLLKHTQKRKQKISGITHPWVYMGMMFSTFCWHVEDLWVNSLNYSHKGGVKTWYIVPGNYKEKFDQFVTQKYCQSSFKKTLLQRITFMVDPLQLIEAGIPVYKTYQHPRDYVCTFFKAYHCGFSQGYNVGQAVNFLSPLSLPIMIEAKKAKKKQHKSSPNVIPLQWLILENYKQIEKFKNHRDLLKKLYDEMIAEERKNLEEAAKAFDINVIQIVPQNAKYEKIMCSVCKEYLYLQGFKLSDQKIYCFQHLMQTNKPLKQSPPSKASRVKVTLIFREPNEDRAAILKGLKIKSKSKAEEYKSLN